jgi:hypothetical protein
MTLTGRNVFFKTGIAFCAASTLFVLAASFAVMPVYPLIEENARRPTEIFQVFVSRFQSVNYFAVHTALVLAVLYSLAGIIMIYYFFEQTQAPEILYISFFTVSFSFEAFRLILPLHLLHDIPSFYLLVAARVLLFGRYFGIFSLFTAGICSAGLDIQKNRNAILIIVTTVLLITASVPIDTQTWDTSLNMVNGYTFMFRLIETIALIAAVSSFFIAVNIRGSKEYAWIGFGAMLAMIGRNILISADNWISPVPGILLLSVGTWFICSQLHKIHLWL